MLIDQVELSLNHVGLGDLTEAALLALFASVQAHRLMEGTNLTLRDFADAGGKALYPGYYCTHLRVPLEKRLEGFHVWDKVDVGVDVSAFGGMLLSSRYAISNAGALQKDSDAWSRGGVPSMEAGSTIVVDGADGEPQPAVPAEGRVATLPKLTSVPPMLAKFRQARKQGHIDTSFLNQARLRANVEYETLLHRDISPGHGIMFAKFTAIADAVERLAFTEHASPRFPRDLAACLTTLERETYYFSNVRSETTLDATFVAQLQESPPESLAKMQDYSLLGVFQTSTLLTDRRTGILLSTCRARRALVVPKARQGLLADGERLVSNWSST